MTRLKSRHSKKRSSFPLFLVTALAIAGVAGYVFITYFEGEKPLISGENFPTYIGKDSKIVLTVSDNKSGIRSIEIVLVQKNKEKVLLNKQYQRGSGDVQKATLKEKIALIVNPKQLKLTDGEATLKITATDYSLRSLLKGNTSVLTHPVTIDTKPPKVSIIHSERYIKPGGAGIVIFTAEDTVSHGVQLNETYHPGFPLTDGSDSKYISYIALPYFTEKITTSSIIAEDAAGNKTVKRFSTVLNKPRQKKDKIHIGDGFLGKKIPEFEEHYPEMKGTMIQQYLYANRTVRNLNNEKIRKLCLNPGEKRLWTGKFLRMAGSGRAGFADHRTYYYKGEAIDKQVHLGMDIASTRHAEIKAANNGTVIFGDYLGIYGNMVMIDHGQGVFSLYSHMSQINVSPGDSLEKGDVIGNSGTSGMAGGDHLHFSMLVNGVFVTPKEWWDQHWIEVTIDGPVVDAKF